MDVLFSVLGQALLFGAGIVAGCILTLIYLLVRTGYFHEKLMFGLPWLKWFTLEEALATGCPLFYCQVLLPAFYIKGYLEIREKDGLSDEEKQRVEGVLDTELLGLYEFRFTKRRNRKPRKKEEPNLAWRPSLPGLPA